MINNPKHIIISRTDSIGDVMLTLPLCGLLKQQFPDTKISFLGRNYTKDIIQCCRFVDSFLNWDEISLLADAQQASSLAQTNADVIIHVFPNKGVLKAAAKARITHRIVTGRRWYSLMYCNHPVFFTRKKSALHEAQLNCKLLKPLGISAVPSLNELDQLTGFVAPQTPLPVDLPDGPKIILHPLSKGSAVNWNLSQFEKLAIALMQRGIHVCVTGTKDEGDRIRLQSQLLHTQVIDLTGKLSLKELIAFISKADGLVAASTGPLHIASALGILSIGLFTPKRPMHPGRWKPIGKNAHVLVASSHPENTDLDISSDAVLGLILSSIKQ